MALTLNYRANITREGAVRAASHYWNKLDRVYLSSNDVRRRNTRIPRACFIEGEHCGRNWHYHVALKVPKTLVESSASLAQAQQSFAQQLIWHWNAMSEAGAYSTAKPIHDTRGWLDYISKDVNSADCEICLRTTHIDCSSDTM